MAKGRKPASSTKKAGPSVASSKSAIDSTTTAPSTASPAPIPSAVQSIESSRTPTPLSGFKDDDDDDEQEDELARKKKKKKPFRFFDLAPEIRLQILEEAFRVTARDVQALYNGKKAAAVRRDIDDQPDPPLDLEPGVNWYLIRPRLSLFLVSRRMHDEAYRVFYTQPIRLFPLHPRFFNTKKPLLARLPPKYRAMITTVELRLGPGWTKPPRGQNTNSSLGLIDCVNLRTLKIFVEIDTSNEFFNGFHGHNATSETYTIFCVDLLEGIIEQVPSLKTVEIDAYPGIKQDAPLIRALRRRSQAAGKALVWGPLRKWEKDHIQAEITQLADAMRELGMSNEARLVEAQA